METSNSTSVNGETVNNEIITSKWGRVDDTNTVFVNDKDGERAVGQYPDGTKAEALAYFERKFDDIEGQIRIAEQRIITGSAGVEVVSTVANLSKLVEAPLAVGDLDSLRQRVTKLEEKAEVFAKEQKELRAKQKEEAFGEREAIVKQAEEIAAKPESKIRWKESGEQMEELFKAWQQSQKQGPNIGKAQADELWKRFKTARNTFDAARRRFFAQMDADNKSVKQRKESLIAKAEELAPKGADGITQYRQLLDEWKQSGRASRKLDDQLWARFKAAGDLLYGAKAEQVAKTDEEYQANYEAKQALLDGAKEILKIDDHQAARKQLTAFLGEWDKLGRVPRNQIKSVEDQLRTIETHVKKLEDDHWAATNPETIARSEGLKGQLEDSIEALKKEIESAQASKNDKKVKELSEQLETQKSWLQAIS